METAHRQLAACLSVKYCIGVRSQDPNDSSDTETRCLVYCCKCMTRAQFWPESDYEYRPLHLAFPKLFLPFYRFLRPPYFNCITSQLMIVANAGQEQRFGQKAIKRKPPFASCPSHLYLSIQNCRLLLHLETVANARQEPSFAQKAITKTAQPRLSFCQVQDLPLPLD